MLNKNYKVCFLNVDDYKYYVADNLTTHMK